MRNGVAAFSNEVSGVGGCVVHGRVVTLLRGESLYPLCGRRLDRPPFKYIKSSILQPHSEDMPLNPLKFGYLR